MGWLTSLTKGASSAVSTIAKSKATVAGLSFIPGVGTAAAVGLAGYQAYDAYQSLTKPAAGAGLPALPGMPAIAPGTTGGFGLPRGPGGGLQLPWNDASTPDALKAYSLDDSYLRAYYRAPRGYVVIRDASGKPYPVLKSAARAMGLWKPAKKPLLSVRDTNAIKRAGTAIKKLQGAEKMAKRIANWKSPRPRIIEVTGKRIK